MIQPPKTSLHCAAGDHRRRGKAAILAATFLGIALVSGCRSVSYPPPGKALATTPAASAALDHRDSPAPIQSRTVEVVPPSPMDQPNKDPATESVTPASAAEPNGQVRPELSTTAKARRAAPPPAKTAMGESSRALAAAIERRTAQIRAELEASKRSAVEAESRAEQARRAQEEAEARAKREATARAEAEERARREAEASKEAEKRAEREAEARARAEQQAARLAAARAEAEEQARSKAEALAKAEEKAKQEAEARTQAEAQAKREAAAFAAAQAEAKRLETARAEAEAQAEQRAAALAEAKETAKRAAEARAQAEERAEREALARAEAEAQARQAAEARTKAEAERQLALDEAQRAKTAGNARGGAAVTAVAESPSQSDTASADNIEEIGEPAAGLPADVLPPPSFTAEPPSEALLLPEVAVAAATTSPRASASAEDALSAHISFDGQSSELSPAAEASLIVLAQKLAQDRSLSARITGYANRSAPDASRQRRQSLMRSMAVRAFLLERGVAMERAVARVLSAPARDPAAEGGIDVVLAPL